MSVIPNLKSLVLNPSAKHTATVIFLHVSSTPLHIRRLLIGQRRVWVIQATGGVNLCQALVLTPVYLMSSGSCLTRK